MAMFDVLAIVPLESPQVFVAEGRRHTRIRFSPVFPTHARTFYLTCQSSMEGAGLSQIA